MSSPKRRRREVEEEHENHERWLVSYADMITVLMALFIVMFAMSQVDEQKYQQLKDGLAVGFGHEKSILSGASPASNSKGVSDPGDASYEMLLAQVPEAQRATVTKILEKSDRLRNGRAAGEARAEVDRLLKVWKRIDTALRRKGLRDDVRATIDDRGLVVSLVSEHVVFEPNVAQLTNRGRRVVDTLAPVLVELTEPIELDGHTNQEKVKPKYYPTDWELSLARAAHVLRRLEEVHGIRATRLRATGFGHTKPLVDPKVRGSQKVNKRVDILVLSQAPAETRALMTDAYEEVRREAGLDPEVGVTGRRADGASAAGRPATTREELP
ncbi:chemotaxis protein MotB [Nocardioides sp. J9]|uniref:OmpA/MotB family protein n=1 Tax=unclassified Nocardioides TaxID=2615069 RepID=UPI0004BC8ED9|nr:MULTISPECIES: flagellar motor protein MotB [unclassified Nocardioides]TWG98613.1 chemotaxis protein MotB [Nocardioides sp. J9]